MSNAIWYAKDAVYWTQGPMIALGHAFGPGGPAAFDHILGCAKLRDEDGRVELTYHALAAAIHLNRPLGSWWADKLPPWVMRRVGEYGEEVAVAIVTALRDLNELADVLDRPFLGQAGFEAHVTYWAKWQFLSEEAPLTSAERQRAKRLREAGYVVSEVTRDVLTPDTGEVVGNLRTLRGVRDLVAKSHESHATA